MLAREKHGFLPDGRTAIQQLEFPIIFFKMLPIILGKRYRLEGLSKAV
jgi:hypothetical protein